MEKVKNMQTKEGQSRECRFKTKLRCLWKSEIRRAFYFHSNLFKTNKSDLTFERSKLRRDFWRQNFFTTHAEEKDGSKKSSFRTVQQV